MSKASDYLENKLLDHTFRNVSFTSPSTVYVALFTSDPMDDGSGTEVAEASYARQPITFGAAVSGSISNSGSVTFPVALTSWGSISHYAIFDAVSAGNMLSHGELDSPIAVGIGNQALIGSSALTINLD